MKVKIYQPTKTTMQAGKAGTRRWVLELEKGEKDYIEPVMQWVGSRDMGFQVRLKFDSQEQAVLFAQQQGWEYRLLEPQNKQFHPKNYANNFTRPGR